MTHLFLVNDLAENNAVIHSVQADSINEAKQCFTDNFFPYLSKIEFDSLCRAMSEIEVVIEYVGTDIIKINHE